MKMRSTTITTVLFIGVVAALSLHTASGAEELALPQLWSAPLEVLLETAAITADVTGDGREEVVIAGHEDLFVLDGRGKTIWHWRSPGRYLTYPTVWSRKGQPGLIYATDYQSNLTCHDGNGTIVWQTKLGAPVLWSASVLCNLDADETPELIQTDDAGTVWAFNAEDGSPVWKAAVKGTPVTPAVDATGRIYIATGAGLLFALDPSGKVLWERPTGGPSPSWATAAPIALENTKALRVAVPSSDGRVLAFDADGELLWARPTRGSISSTLSAADFDADGVMDLFAITQLGTVMRFDESGRVLWDIDMQGRTLAPGAIADINGDGKLEYLLSTQSGNLLVFDQAGRIVFNHQFNNRTINATPAIADVSPDSPGLELVITGGESGKVFCLGSPAPASAAQPWRMYRADASNRGNAGHIAEAAEAANRMSPRNLAWDGLCSGDEVVFDIAKAVDDGKVVTAMASCVRPDGARQVAMGRVLRQHGTLRLPVAVAVPGVYRFEWSFADEAGKVLASGERELTLQPFAADRAVVARAADALARSAEAAQAVLPESSAALRREAALLVIDAAAARPLQEKSAAGNAEEEALLASAAVVQKARRALQLADIVAKAAAQGPGTSLVVTKGDLWESRGVGALLPDGASTTWSLENRVLPGEHEPVALNLFNVTDRELVVRVLAETSEGGPRVTLHRAVSMPTARGEEAWDALPELDNAALVSIPSLSTRQVWVDSDFANAKAGDCAVKVRFLATNGAGILSAPATAPQDKPSPEAVAELKFKVIPFEMASSGVFRLCSWASLDDATIPDLLAHGNNVFCVPLPEAKYNEQGQLGPSDYTKTDAILNKLKGLDVMVLLTHEPVLKAALGTPEHAKDLKPYLDELVDHMAKLGFDTNHFGFYPVDEPGGGGWNAVNHLIDIAKAIKGARPELMLYVDGGGDGAMYEAMGPWIDIWTPSIYQLADDTADMRVMRSTGKMLWSYNCAYAYSRPTGPNIKDINVVAEFRNAAIYALRYGVTGIGFWSYNLGGDPWGRIKDEYVLVYPGASKPVTSRRWEAVRESIEDYRILMALKNAKDLPENAKAATATLLDKTVPAIIDASNEEMRQGFSREAIDAGNNTAGVERFRAQLIDAVDAALAKP